MENEPEAVENGESGCENTANGGINHLDSTPHASGNAANQAGSSFSVLPPATTFEEQLNKMENRGLAIDDSNFAIAKLRDLNYYRLRGYWLTLEDDGSFIKGTSFSDIWEIYQLDRELRRWLWQAMAPIEIKLRTQFAYEFAHRCGPDAYLDSANYHLQDRFDKALANYERERDRAYSQGVPYVVHNMDKYGKLPVWAAVEIMSFGTLSMFYGNLDLAIGLDEDGEIQQAAVEELRHLDRAAAHEVECHMRLLFAQMADDVRDKMHHIRLRAAEMHLAARHVVKRRNLLRRTLLEIDDLLRAALQEESFLRQMDFAAAALKKPLAELVLEVSELARQVRLRRQQSLRRARDVPFLRDGEEVFQDADLHGNAPLSLCFHDAVLSAPSPGHACKKSKNFRLFTRKCG